MFNPINEIVRVVVCAVILIAAAASASANATDKELDLFDIDEFIYGDCMPVTEYSEFYMCLTPEGGVVYTNVKPSRHDQERYRQLRDEWINEFIKSLNKSGSQKRDLNMMNKD